MGHFPDLKIDHTSLPGDQRLLVILEGNIKVNYKGVDYPIYTIILFPPLYPGAPPDIKIKNVDP